MTLVQNHHEYLSVKAFEINWIDNKWRVMFVTKTPVSEKCTQRTYNDVLLLQKPLQISNPASRVPILLKEDMLINLKREDSVNV